MNSINQESIDDNSEENDFNMHTISLKSNYKLNDSNSQIEFENIPLDNTITKNISIMSLGNSINENNLYCFRNKTQILLSSLQVNHIDPKSSNTITEASSIYSLFSQFQLSSHYNASKKEFQFKEYARILEYAFRDTKYDKQLYAKYIKTFTYFSTTKSFSPILYNNIKYTSDHPWGSLIRTYQMILAKFFIDIQIHHYVNQTLKIDINLKSTNPTHLYLDDATYSQLKYEMLLLFTDNPILIGNLLNIQYYDALIKQMPSLLQQYTQELEDNKDSFIVNKVIAPLSIGLIANSYKLIQSSQMSSFEVKIELNHSVMVDIIREIIDQFSLFDNKIEVILFDSFISEEVIMSKCFVKFNDNICSKDIYMFNINQTIQYKNREYSLKDGLSTLIFSEINVGQNGIDNDYQNIVTEVFKVRNNLGFIGSLKKSPSSYMYFIGETKGKLIALNPNKCRNSIQDIKEYLDYETFMSFQPNSSNTALVSMKELGPQLILCFQFKCIKEYKDLVIDLKKHSSLEKKLFEFEEDGSNANLKNSNNGDNEYKMDDSIRRSSIND